MQHLYMQRLGLILFCCLALVSLQATASTYTLTDGTKIEGEAISENDHGVIFRTADGTETDRKNWDMLTQDTIRTLLAEAKSQRQKDLLEPLIEETSQERVQREQNKEIIVKPVEFPARPKKTQASIFAIFGSPVGWFILLAVYGANLFAAYEVAIYRRRSLGTVCGLAAIPFFGVFSPIVFISMPTQKIFFEGQPEGFGEMPEKHTRFRSTPPPTAVTEPSAEEVEALNPVMTEDQQALPQSPLAPPQATMPEPIVFKRGDFLFNRRFFETKLATFFRLVPSEADKDMVVLIQSARGNFIGRRITKVTQTELYLQVFHDNATADEMIPFAEILEVQIRHKDAP